MITVLMCTFQCNSGTGISEDMFYSWLLREPQILVWLPTYHRAAASETGILSQVYTPGCIHC